METYSRRKDKIIAKKRENNCHTGLRVCACETDVLVIFVPGNGFPKGLAEEESYILRPQRDVKYIFTTRQQGRIVNEYYHICLYMNIYCRMCFDA